MIDVLVLVDENVAIASPETTTDVFTLGEETDHRGDQTAEVQGPGALEISQGDALAGIISRKDLAEVAVEAAALGSGPLLKDASFELYYTKGAQPCEGKFKKLLADEAFPRLHGDSYAALFKGVRRDGTYDVPA